MNFIVRCALTLLCCGSFASSLLAAEPAKLPSTTPWNLEELNKPPTFEWVEKTEPIRSLFYEGEKYNGKPTRVFAYYASPRTLGIAMQNNPHPAIVLVHGGGGTAFREWAELWARNGYVAIAMDLAGHRPKEGVNAHDRKNRTRLEDGGPDQGDDEKFGSVMKEPGEQWPYHAVANVIRAHSLVRSFEEVDPEKTAVTGISWGGYLTCIVAGVDNRFKAAVPVYGCGHLQENSAWVDRLNKMPAEQRDRWTQLWDPKQYLPSVSMPILFVNGTNDFAYPLDSYLKSYNDVPGDKQMRVTVNMPHGHPAGWEPKEIALYIHQSFDKANYLPRLGEPKHAGKEITVSVEGPKPVEAHLHYTTDGGPINKRSWKSVPATFSDKQVTVAAPPGNTSIWFLTVTGEKGGTLSTRVMIKE